MRMISVRTGLALSIALTALTLAGCGQRGALKNPFAKEKPFIPSEVPADFQVIINENHDTFYARQHIEQTISASDMMSRTEYTTFRDLNNTISNQFSTEQPLNDVQLQSMWNEVARNGLLEGGTVWINWRSDADLYRRNMHTIRIRANGIAKTYSQRNGFAGSLRGLMLQVDAVRLPLTQTATQPVYGAPAHTPRHSDAPALPLTPATPIDPAHTQPDMPTTAPGN